MRDRVRIMLGNREIVKRYIGDRLVWEQIILKVMTIEGRINISNNLITLNAENIKKRLEGKRIRKISIAQGKEHAVEFTKYSIFLSDYILSIRNYDNEFKEYLLNNGAKYRTYVRFKVQFYYE